jgi:diguanylate cyclase (GGDEF)-like protein
MKRRPESAAMGKELLAEIEAERKRQSERPPDLRRDMVELNVLRAFGAAVNERLELSEILDAARTHLPRLLEYSVLAVLVHVGQPELHVYPSEGTSAGVVHMSVRNLIDVHRQLYTGTVNDEDIPIFVGGHRRELGPPPSSDDILQSHITLPLVSASETIGVVSVGSFQPAAFGPLDLQLFSLVTHQLSAAVRNSLLLRQSQEQAIRDSLTGVFNRRYFSERAEEELRRAKRYQHPLAIVLADIDHFKQINDRFGHQVGDEVLRCTAGALAEGLRTSDVLCRYGGEEFVILLPESTTEEAVMVAERLRSMVTARARALRHVKMAVNMSFGVASTAEAEAPTVESLLQLADGALYYAKRSGRNRVCTPFMEGTLLAGPSSTREQRRFPRMPASLPLRYMIVPDLGDAAPRGRSIDVGAGGLSLELDQPVPPGTFVLVDIDDGAGRPVRVLAKVVWIREEPGRAVIAGARIVSFEGGDEERFERLAGRSTSVLPPASPSTIPSPPPDEAAASDPEPSARGARSEDPPRS